MMMMMMMMMKVMILLSLISNRSFRSDEAYKLHRSSPLRTSCAGHSEAIVVDRCHRISYSDNRHHFYHSRRQHDMVQRHQLQLISRRCK